MARLLLSLLLALSFPACTTETVSWVEPPVIEEPDEPPAPTDDDDDDDEDDDDDDDDGKGHGRGRGRGRH